MLEAENQDPRKGEREDLRGSWEGKREKKSEIEQDILFLSLLFFSRSHVPLSGSLIFLIFSSVKSRGRGGYVLGGNNSGFIQVKRRPRNLCYPSLLKWQ